MTATLIDGTPVGISLAYKELVDNQLWDRLIEHIINNEHMDRSLAVRVMNEALGLLLLCAKDPASKYSPSDLVDAGVHAFLDRPDAFEAFCLRIAGRPLQHVPIDSFVGDYAEAKDPAMTMQAMCAYGPADETLWVDILRGSDPEPPEPPSRPARCVISA